jgi:DNA-binding protein HU-beta
MVTTKKTMVLAKAPIVGKAKLVERVHNSKGKKNNLTKSQIEAVISGVLEEIKKSLIKKEEIRLPSYFSLKTAVQATRMAMNLQTGKKMTIPAKRVPKIKFSLDLKEEIAKAK